jgi:hypothetical protein
VHLQVRIVAATLLLAALAIGTGTVLLLGYWLAAFSIGVIILIMTRKMIAHSSRDAGMTRFKPGLVAPSRNADSFRHADPRAILPDSWSASVKPSAPIEFSKR